MLIKEKILIVAGSRLIFQELEDILGSTYELVCFGNSEKITAKAKEIKPVLILLDIILPSKGIEIIAELKAEPALSDIPVIFLTESGDEEQGFELGAVDVITKPLKPRVVKARVKQQVDTYINNVSTMLTKECFKALIQQTNKVVFECDFFTEKIQSLFNFEAIFGRSPFTKNSATDAINANVIHPDDVNAFKDMFSCIRSGHNVPEVKIRIKDSNGEYKWSLLSAAVMSNKHGDLYKALAMLEDIDAGVKLSQVSSNRLDAAIINSKLCMFEFYIAEQRTVCSPVTMEIFGTPHIIENAVETVLAAGIVHPSYVEKFRETYRKISNGSPLEQLELIQFRKDGSEIFVELTLTTVFDKQGRPFVAIGLMKDLSDRLLLIKQVYYDELTGSRNLTKFKLDATELIKENPQLGYMVIKLDIDRFKLLNEVYGYEVCDKILIEFSKAVELSLDPKCDIHARINADEFILLIGFTDDDSLVEKIKQKDKLVDEYLQQLIPDKIYIRKGRYSIEKGETNFNAIFEKVNFAHRFAKTNNILVCNYDDEIKKIALKKKDIESRMEAALLNEEFKVFLQPKYRLSDETIVGVEALVRWMPNKQDIVYPGSFIPVFEQNGFITRLDMYMFEQSCKLIRNWIDSGIAPVAISVNFSRLHLNDITFVSRLSELSNKYCIPHNLLEIEITETAIFDNIGILENVLAELHGEGFTLSMDDFGTGYSSLGLLKSIPVDVIKMDKSFFDDSQNNARARLVIGSVMDMAKKLNAHTVAEGVETKENVDLLKSLGCDIVQGYYYARPMPAEEFTNKCIMFTATDYKLGSK